MWVAIAIPAGCLLAFAAAAAEPAPTTSATAAGAAPETAAPEVAIFAGGCFWSMESALESIPGVISAVSGFTGGEQPNPTYEQVSNGRTGHYESVQVTFDPAKVTYAKILDVYWKNIDPLAPDGQFCDFGPQYRPAIFYQGPEQKKAAEVSRRHWTESGRFARPLAPAILQAGPFYRAEDYHQDYARRNPVDYGRYRTGCRRDARLKELWGEDAGGGIAH